MASGGVNTKVASKGTEFMKKGDEALKKFSFMGMFSPHSKYEEAQENYTKAANNYKMAKDWRSASQAFMKCAEMSGNLGSQHEQANFYIQAADALGKVEPAAAVPLYKQAIDTYCEMGRFTTAAKHLESVAKIQESANDLGKAVETYQQASDYYLGENSTSKANKCLEQVAFLSATLANYDVAVNAFEQLGTTALESNLLQFSAKKHFLHAGICHLARGDSEGAIQGNDKYGQLDFSFADSREGKLLADLIEAYEALDADKFAEKLFAYDSISKLTPWQTSILLRIKNALSTDVTPDGEELDEDDLT